MLRRPTTTTDRTTSADTVRLSGGVIGPVSAGVPATVPGESWTRAAGTGRVGGDEPMSHTREV